MLSMKKPTLGRFTNSAEKIRKRTMIECENNNTNNNTNAINDNSHDIDNSDDYDNGDDNNDNLTNKKR